MDLKSPIIIAVMASTLVLNCAVAMEFWVGDSAGWTINFDYQKWASDKVFHVGDTLVFRYDKDRHNVHKSNQTEFQTCTVAPNSPLLNSGHDVITLAAPGKKWYICGVPGHCADHNQKLAINVLDAGALAPAPMAPMAPPPSDSAHSLLTSNYQFLMTLVVAVAVLAFAMI